jgi:type I restriction enzyme S subunit
VIDNALAAGNPIPDELAPRAEVRKKALANGTANREAAKPFPDAFQETESMGWIPEGWDGKELGELAQNIREGVDPTTLPHETPYVGLEHVDRQSFSLSRWGVATDVDSQKSHFKPKDFLFGKLRPYFHKVCHVTSEGICSTDILVIRPHKEKDAGYVGCQIFEPEFVEYANLRSTGTRMPRASWKDMAKYEVACPPESLRKTFNCQIEPIREKCAGAVAANNTLTKLRDTLLPKLISGELRIPEAEQLIEKTLDV